MSCRKTLEECYAFGESIISYTKRDCFRSFKNQRVHKTSIYVPGVFMKIFYFQCLKSLHYLQLRIQNITPIGNIVRLNLNT
uniref:Uncharacterized protein n=1 Tax=Arundo donax TaxID=35708 RepID=A0A0A9FQE1_ARUDO